jgi:large subunit ribosomal protein L9
MQVILLERIERLGKMGDVVDVKPGYARNFLLPQKKALRATNEAIAEFEKKRAVLEMQSKDLALQAEGMKKTIDGQVFLVARQCSEAGSLYGSVSARDIADVVSQKLEHLTRHHVVLETPIKTTGVYAIALRLHPEVLASVTVSIAPSEAEAKSLLEKHTAEKAARESEKLKSSKAKKAKETEETDVVAEVAAEQVAEIA